MKKKLNLWLEEEAYDRLTLLSKHARISRSRIVEELVLANQKDPSLSSGHFSKAILQLVNGVDGRLHPTPAIVLSTPEPESSARHPKGKKRTRGTGQ